MAILLPFIIRYKTGISTSGTIKTVTLPLLVNPTDITVKKRAQISEVRTMAGTVFQPWPNVPDEIGIKGVMYGTRSALDFNTLENTIDKRPDLKEVDLIYKWKTYHGYVRDLTVSAAADKPRQFNYDFTFVSKDAFSLPRMMLGQLTGYKNEIDYLKSQLYGLKNSLKNDPITGVANLASIGLSLGPNNAWASVQKILNSNK